jgi:hypothetical protein
MTKALPTTALSTDEIVALLKKHDKNVVKNILKQVDTAAALEKRGNNVELRKAAMQKAVAESNSVAIAEFTAATDKIVPLGQELAADSDEIIAGGLNEEQVVTAMNLFLSVKLATEGADAMKDMVRNMVFRSMDLAAAEEGEEFPEHTNMVMDVPEIGKRFCREGAGRKDAEFDMDKLRAAVGDEVFFAITAEKVEVTRVVDDQALSVAILANPQLMEQMRDAVKPGDWKSARLMVRDIPANEKE